LLRDHLCPHYSGVPHHRSLCVTRTLRSGRDFLWARYADWAFTTPLLLIDLGLLAGVSLSEIYFIVLCDILMVVAGFAGAVSTGAYAAWPLFIFGCVAAGALHGCSGSSCSSYVAAAALCVTSRAQACRRRGT